jgi:hypothetical protein
VSRPSELAGPVVQVDDLATDLRWPAYDSGRGILLFEIDESMRDLVARLAQEAEQSTAPVLGALAKFFGRIVDVCSTLA